MGCCATLFKEDNEDIYVDLGCKVTEVMSDVIHEFFDIYGYHQEYEGYVYTKTKLQTFYTFLLEKAYDFIKNEKYKECSILLDYMEEIKEKIESGDLNKSDIVIIEIEC